MEDSLGHLVAHQIQMSLQVTETSTVLQELLEKTYNRTVDIM